MKHEPELGIKIHLSRVQNRVIEAILVSGRALCGIVNDGKYVKNYVSMLFSTPHKPRLKKCTKGDLGDAVLRIVVHNFYLTEKRRPALKEIHAKMPKPVTRTVCPH
jgi:hypothetical protein